MLRSSGAQTIPHTEILRDMMMDVGTGVSTCFGIVSVGRATAHEEHLWGKMRVLGQTALHAG